MVAVAILGMSLTSLLSSQITSLRAMRYAHSLSAAAFLAEFQLHEIEWELQNDGWPSNDVEFEGDFSDQDKPITINYDFQGCSMSLFELL